MVASCPATRSATAVWVTTTGAAASSSIMLMRCAG